MVYERQFFEYLENLKHRIRTQPLVLGGVSTSGGGVGGPPGGFIGLLPQTRVTYDKKEAELSGTNVSGSLLDNLNHIRYRIAQLEAASGSGGGSSDFLGLTDTPSAYTGDTGKVVVVNATEDGLEFQAQGSGSDTYKSKISSDDTTEDFLENKIVAGTDIQITVLNPGANESLEITSTASGSGGSSGFNYIQEDLTNQIPASNDDYSLSYTPASGTLVLHYNGITQQYDNYTLLASGVHTKFSPVSGDELISEYYYDTSGEGITDPTISVYSGNTLINSSVNSLKFLGMSVADNGGGQVTVSGSSASGGGSTPGDETGTIWSADAKPSSPSTYDDEFDDSSVDAKWNDYDVPSTLTYTENEFGFEFTAHETDFDVQGIYQDAPSSNGWSIMTKVSVLHLQENDLKAGLLLLEDTANLSTSGCIFHNFTVGGAGTGIQCESFNAYNSYNSNHGSSNNDKWLTTMYLRLRAPSDNNWYFDWSSDGIGWINKDTWTITRLWAPDAFGINIRGNTTSPRFLFHWFRYSTNTGVTDIVEGDRIKYWSNA